MYGEKLKNATYAFNRRDGEHCGDGTLLNVIMRTLTPIACKLAEFFEDIDKNSLIKVCFLHQLSKAIMVEPNENTWEIENRGILYKFVESQSAMKMGIRTVLMCMTSGIKLSEFELEAISNLDREEDKQTRFFSSPLSLILKQSIEITETKNRINNNKKDE